MRYPDLSECTLILVEEKKEAEGGDLIGRAVTPHVCDGVTAAVLKAEDGSRPSPVFSEPLKKQFHFIAAFPPADGNRCVALSNATFPYRLDLDPGMLLISKHTQEFSYMF